MRKTSIIFTFIILAITLAAPLCAARPAKCRPEWTRFNCAIYIMGADEIAANQDGMLSPTLWGRLTDAHGAIFWTARGQQVSEPSDYSMSLLALRLNDYRITVGQLEHIGEISHSAASRLIVDSVDVEDALRAGGPWFNK